MKHWTSRLTAVLLAGVLLCAGVPAAGAEAPQSEWYAHFEQSGAADTIQAGTAAEVSLVETEACGGLQSVKLVTSEEGWPDANRQCLQITPMSGDTFDASGYTHLIFYIKDVWGHNTLCCYLSDGTTVSQDGAWTGAAQQGEWTRMVIDLRSEVYNEIDKSRLTKVVLAQYTAGTYYIDSVFFATSADAPLPSGAEGMDNRFIRLFAECETVYEAGRQDYSEASWNPFVLVMEALSAQKDTFGNLDSVTLGQYYDTLWNVYHSLQKQGENFLPGDVNLDGTVDSSDARLVLQYTVDAAVLTDKALAQADITGDGTVDSGDARVILQRTVA